MSHKQYFKKIDVFTNQEVKDALPVLCPLNNYYDPNLPIPYLPDEAIPEITPGDGEIILFMTDAWDAAINTTTTVSLSGKARYTIYGENDTELYTEDVNSGNTFFKLLPTSGGISLSGGLNGFKVIIKPATVGSITIFRFATKSGYAVNGWPVIEAHIKCPSITSLTQAFNAQKALQLVKFYGNHNSLTTLYYFASDCISLIECQMNVEMNVLTDMERLFYNTPLLEVATFPLSLPLLTKLTLAFYQCGLKVSPLLPNVLPELTTASSCYQSMPRLKGTLTIPDCPKATAVTYLAATIPNITKIMCLGSFIPNNTSNGGMFSDCAQLIEIDMSAGTIGKTGVNWTFTSAINKCQSLRIFKLPTIIRNINVTTDLSNEVNNSLLELTQADWSANSIATFYCRFINLKRFDQPTLKTNYLFAYFTSTRYGVLEYFEIDWANSFIGTTGTVINLSYNNFGTTEINRIFSSLPAAVGSQTITISSNPGYATCDKTIATAKGWTVN